METHSGQAEIKLALLEISLASHLAIIHTHGISMFGRRRNIGTTGKQEGHSWGCGLHQTLYCHKRLHIGFSAKL